MTTYILTILIPVDGSPLGERPLPYARLIARAAGAPIKLIEVVPRPAKASAQSPLMRFRGYSPISRD